MSCRPGAEARSQGTPTVRESALAAGETPPLPRARSPHLLTLSGLQPSWPRKQTHVNAPHGICFRKHVSQATRNRKNDF